MVKMQKKDIFGYDFEMTDARKIILYDLLRQEEIYGKFIKI